MTIRQRKPPLRHTLLLATSSALLALPAGAALAQGEAARDPNRTASLQAQVDTLTALVKQLAAKDEALQTQVQTLQAQVNSQPVQTATAPAVPEPYAATPQTGEGAPNISLAGQGGAGTIASAGKPQPKVAINDNNHFSLQSADGRYSIGMVGVAQFDAGGYIGFHPESRHVGPQNLSTGVNARRARIGLSGAAGDFSYTFIYDGGNSQDTTQRGIEALQLSYSGIKGLAAEIGYSATPFTLDQATSSNDLLFLERSTPTNIAINLNAGDFRSNAGVRLFSDWYWLGGYVTGPSSSSDSHTQTGERFGAFQRAAFQVLRGRDYSLHLGVAYDELIRAPNSGDTTNSAASNGTPDTLSLSDQPELRIDPTTLVNSGTIGTAANPVASGSVLDLETAGTWMNLFYQGEYFHYTIDRRGLADVGFNGGYAQIAWIATGENHRYNPASGSYTRVVPKHPFSMATGDLGAWELAARVSYIDEIANYIPRLALASQAKAINGGRQAGYTLGLNWYPSYIVRIMLDYNHIDFDKSQTATATGAPLGTNIGARFDAVSLRSQVVF